MQRTGSCGRNPADGGSGCQPGELGRESLVNLALDADAIARLKRGFPPGAATGFRYPEAQLKTLGI
jgi:hypothetical protein